MMKTIRAQYAPKLLSVPSTNYAVNWRDFKNISPAS